MCRLTKISLILQPATILKFHRALVERKFQKLCSKKNKQKPGRKGPSQEIIDLVLALKQRNPRYGYCRIAMQIFQSFGIKISCFAVGRIQRKYLPPEGNGDNGFSWLTFIGHTVDSLWSVDFFKCESINLKTHTVMVIIDQFSRRIIGFSVFAGDPFGTDVCHMFNKIVFKKPFPKYLSSDNDPLFLYHRWKANLRILDIEEIKSVAYTPESHPFIERAIGSVKRELLEQMTPSQVADPATTFTSAAFLSNYRWQSHCNGLFSTPVAV